MLFLTIIKTLSDNNHNNIKQNKMLLKNIYNIVKQKSFRAVKQQS